MSPQEVGYRTLDLARRRAWARRRVPLGAPAALPPDLLPDRGFAVGLAGITPDQVPAQAATALVAAAERVLDGSWEVLGTRRTDSADPDWFADPTTRRRAPQDVLAFAVNHRDEQVTGNIKQLWEMSRHHHLTVLAAAWWLTREDRYAQAAADQLRSWWRANPFLSGVHWTSGIELGIRLISWAWVRRLLEDWPKVGDLFEGDDDALRQIAWHQEYLAAFPSRGSSANNHVIAEAAGLLVAACAFPWFGRSTYWRRTGKSLLEREFEANTFPSGLNRELATEYQGLVLELVIAAAAESDAVGDGLSPVTWQRITDGLDAAASLLDCAGRPPRQGDGDEGRALVLDDPKRHPWPILLASGAALVEAPDWWPSNEPCVGSSLLAAVGRAHTTTHAPQHRRWFADAGCALLVSRPEDGPEIWCRADSGPHGFTSIAAHAHADALSIELRHDGVEILADPGTYCYHGEPAWRSWFRSTAAHNTVEVAGRDQSESGGPFMWTRHAATRTLECQVGEGAIQTWTAEHDGYVSGTPSVTHRRSVHLDSPGRRLVVEDTVTSSGPVPVRLSWHLGPDVHAALDGHLGTLGWPADGQQHGGRLHLPVELAWTVLRGTDKPIEGWYAPGFSSRIETSTMVGRGSVHGTALWTTLVELP